MMTQNQEIQKQGGFTVDPQIADENDRTNSLETTSLQSIKETVEAELIES